MDVIGDVLLVVGLLAIMVGVVLLSLPMGLIVGGVEAVAVALVMARSQEGDR